MRLETIFPAILLLAIAGVSVAVYRLRSVALSDSLRAKAAKDAQDGLYQCSKNLEKVTEHLKTRNIVEAYSLLMETADKVRSYNQESFSTIEWKRFFEETLESVRSYESYFSVNHSSITSVVAKRYERRKNEVIAEEQSSRNIYALTVILFVCSIPLLWALLSKIVN